MAQRRYVARQIGNRTQKESARGDGGEKREGGTQEEKSAQKNGASAYCRGM